MSTQPDLLPNILHRIGSSNRGPVVEEELDLHLRDLGVSANDGQLIRVSHLPDFLERSGEGRERLIRDIVHGE